MAQPDLRQIITAFAEKGWNLYEEGLFPPKRTLYHCERRDVLRGPVDNIIPTKAYLILPAVEKAADMVAVAGEEERMKEHNLYPLYRHEGNEVLVRSFGVFGFSTEPVALFKTLDADTFFVSLPLERAAELIRENLSKYDRGQNGRA